MTNIERLLQDYIAENSQLRVDVRLLQYTIEEMQKEIATLKAERGDAHEVNDVPVLGGDSDVQPSV